MEIQVEITNQCPNNCIHCSSYDLRMNHLPFKATTESLMSLLHHISGKKTILLTGGEPLCVNHLTGICRTLHTLRDTDIGLYTSGIHMVNSNPRAVTDEYATELFSAGVVECYVSLYGCDSKTHNFITNSDTFHLTCESIRNFIKAGITTNAHIVISKQTINHLSDIVQFAFELGMHSARLLKLSKSGNAANNWELIGIDSTSQNAQILQVITGWQHQKEFKISVSGFPKYMPCRPNEDSKGCQRGISLIYITYDGLVFPCACAKGKSREQIGSLDDIDALISALNAYRSIFCFENCLNNNDGLEQKFEYI